MRVSKKDLNAIQEVPLKTWGLLNEHLRTADEKECRRLLAIEQKGCKRKRVIMRIYSRINRTRRVREWREMLDA